MTPMHDSVRVLGQIERGEIRVGADAAREIAARHEAAYGTAWTTAPVTRRDWLAARIAASPGEWTTHDAEQALANSPFSCHRNTARKDMRALAARGVLTAADHDGRRYYTPVKPGRGAV